MNKLHFKEELYLKIMNLSQNVWEGKFKQENLDAWLENFVKSDTLKDCEQAHALYLLSNFTYFGIREIREMLKSAYRDKVKNPLIQEIRRSLSDSKDNTLIQEKYNSALEETKFLGIGNPSESGTHLLYFFRQENHLEKDQFIHTHEILKITRTKIKDTPDRVSISLRNKKIRRYVFIDDVCGSGDQVIDYMTDILNELKDLDEKIETHYITLIASKKGLKAVRDSGIFNKVECIFELDNSYKCFSQESRYFTERQKVPMEKQFSEEMSKKYGSIIEPIIGCHGYKNGQYLLGFSHNTPDNTLPIFWSEQNSWTPIFKRYSKLY